MLYGMGDNLMLFTTGKQGLIWERDYQWPVTILELNLNLKPIISIRAILVKSMEELISFTLLRYLPDID